MDRATFDSAQVTSLDAADVAALAVELEETDKNDDLELRVRGQRIPLVRRATGGSNLVIPIALADETLLLKCRSPTQDITFLLCKPPSSMNTAGRTAIESIARTKSRP